MWKGVLMWPWDLVVHFQWWWWNLISIYDFHWGIQLDFRTLTVQSIFTIITSHNVLGFDWCSLPATLHIVKFLNFVLNELFIIQQLFFVKINAFPIDVWFLSFQIFECQLNHFFLIMIGRGFLWWERFISHLFIVWFCDKANARLRGINFEVFGEAWLDRSLRCTNVNFHSLDGFHSLLKTIIYFHGC